MTQKITRISEIERGKIELFLRKGHSKNKIAKYLNRSRTSIKNEILRNSVKGVYDPQVAEMIKDQRILNRQKRKKLEIKPYLLEYVIKGLRQNWSPHVIAGRLKMQAGGKNVISHETIYKFIYSKVGKEMQLFKFLPHKKKPVRESLGERKHRITLKDRTPIEMRPVFVNERQDFGHWEEDLIVFKQQKRVVSVAVERITGFTVMTILQDKTAEERKYAMNRLIYDIGQNFVKSSTMDNGTENAYHWQIKEEVPNFETFFCNPYCSWEKGQVEQLNKLIRKFLPKDFYVGKLNQRQIDRVAEILNNRPRKFLGWKTPKEAFEIWKSGKEFFRPN